MALRWDRHFSDPSHDADCSRKHILFTSRPLRESDFSSSHRLLVGIVPLFFACFLSFFLSFVRSFVRSFVLFSSLAHHTPGCCLCCCACRRGKEDSEWLLLSFLLLLLLLVPLSHRLFFFLFFFLFGGFWDAEKYHNRKFNFSNHAFLPYKFNTQ